ncbi:MAG: NAD(+) synthase [Muribaculaceae bacterium]|nr:NAD(+) synthase [Muribaculaceae bacterium]
MKKTNKRTVTDYGLVRVAAVVPQVNVADVEGNTAHIIDAVDDAVKAGAHVVVLPELCVTAYTCGDLFGNDLLLDAAEQALVTLCDHYKDTPAMIVVGAPLRSNGHLFNCAVVINGGEMWVVPKTYIPNYKEFYEKRWFTTSNITAIAGKDSIVVGGEEVPFGTHMIFEAGHARVAVEICEDLWVPAPPSSIAAINGANVIVNLSASNELIGKHTYLMDLIKHQSAHCIAAYVYASCGYGESTTDLVFGGNAVIAENGKMLAEGQRFTTEAQMSIADIDIAALENERRVNGSFADSMVQFGTPFERIAMAVAGPLDYEKTELKRPVRRLPFVPEEDERLTARCEEIIAIQTEGLMRRLDFTGIPTIVVGVSGGLDSTLALLVAVRTFDRMGRSRKDIHAITMPGFGTTDRTYTNACALVKSLGVTLHEISIADAVTQHFKDIGHNPKNHDVTYENSQARERTQILMDFSNKVNGLVLGTGDLSELALGWATYNGDHMSMYNVNVSIPKTLVRHLVRWFATSFHDGTKKGKAIHDTLFDVLDTPISPELTPAAKDGTILQVTEDIVGPYELHDFFLYHMLRYGYPPAKLYMLARTAFKGVYDNTTIKKWLRTFMRRFFNQQFKRSCLPDGPKVGSVSLSPRGDWRMPSDASSRLWLKQCDELAE